MFGTHAIKNKIPLILTGFFLTFLVAVLYLKRPLYLDYMDNKLYDIQLQSHHQEQQTGIPIVVDVDESSLKDFGQWPWPRYRISQLLEKIQQSGVSSVGVDILFAEADQTSLATIDHSMKNYFKDRLGPAYSFIADNLPEDLTDNDMALARTLSQGNFVLGYAFDFSSHGATSAAPLLKPLNPIILEAPGAKKISNYLISAPGVVAPLSILSKSAGNTGFFNTTADRDGILRATPLIMRWNEKIYPSLSLATLLTALGNPPTAVKVTPGGIESIQIGASTIPLDKNGRFFVHYRGSGNQFKTLSASLFLKDKIAPGSLQGKTAIVGTSAAGLKDLKSTPLDSTLMGAQVHATVIDNILKKDFITWPDVTRQSWVQGMETCIIILFGVLTTLAITWARPWMTLAFSAGISIIIWQCSVYAFEQKQLFLSPLFSFIILGLNFSVLSLLKFYFSEKDRLFLKKAFSNYVSDDLIEDIVEKPDHLRLGGQVKPATVLFCDLENFTNISENRSPHEIVDIMSQYFEEMTKYVFKHKGALKDYIGDELMALFGAPLSEEDHAANACRAALDMQHFLTRLRQENHSSGLPPLSARVGINTGEMLIGNIGSKYRFSYGIMGDNVNLGSRLEGLNKIYGTKIMIGQNTAQSAKNHFILRHLGAVRVKGKENPEKVYELVAHKETSLADNHKKSLDCYHTGYNYYLNQEWTRAIEIFEEGRSLMPEDLAFTVMIQRCGMYNRLPRMEDFNGVFIERRK